MIGPSNKVHCEPCLFEQVHEQNISARMQLLEAQIVKMFAGRLASNKEPILPPTEKTPPIAYERHQAAVMCAMTILKRDCPLFIYAENAAGYKTVLNRPPEPEGFGGLRSVK